MALTPRNTLNEEFIKGMSCAICGNPILTINHIEKYPDFVSCNQCGAAFVVENEGSWVMYGKIPAEYPQTSEFALRQWTWLDAVAQRAADEREMGSAPPFTPQEPPQEVDIAPSEIKESAPTLIEDSSHDQAEEVFEPAPLEDQIRKNEIVEDMVQHPPYPESIQTYPEEELEIPVEDDFLESISDDTFELDEELIPSPFEPIDRIETDTEARPDRIEDEIFPAFEGLDEGTQDALFAERPDTSVHFTEERSAEEELIAPIRVQKIPDKLEERSEEKPSSIPVGEPEPDKRFRVTIRGGRTNYPKNFCAHCLRTPVKDKTIMRGNLPDPNRPGKRRLVSLDLPFCRDCQKRMNAQSEEEKNARLLAFLLSGLVALIGIVATLASGIINPGENLLGSLTVLLIVGILGFSIPLLIMLSRASRYPPPRDAAFVLSTLMVNESGVDLTEFEWRNLGYAELFRQVNQANAVGEVVSTQDRVTFTEIPQEKIQEKKEKQPKSKPSKKPIEEDKIVADSEKNT
jgi:hypothetical protein